MTKYKTKYPYPVGIDLGTSNSCVAVKIGKQIQVIDAKEGVSKQGKTLASCVSFTENETLVGDFAKNRLVIAPHETVYQAKRHIGTTKTWTIRGKEYRPEQISAYILMKLKEAVEEQVEAEITEAVITVPAQFDDLQRKATEDAAKIAGLTCLRLINEPTAAALAYDFQDLNIPQNILVVDLGGGTLDVSILKCEESVFSVIATGGDTHLGGKDIDDAMIKYTVDEIRKNYNYDISNDQDALEKVRCAVEETKITLSSVSSTELIIPYLGLKDSKPVSVNMAYSRSLLEQQIKGILDKLKTTVLDTLSDAKLDKTQLNKLLLVGGPMNMPVVRRTIEELLGISASTSLNPNNCVAIGAAKQAATLATNIDEESSGDSNILLLDVTPLSLGLAVEGDIFSKIIEKNSHIPTKNVMKYTTAEDNQESVEIRILQGERPIASQNKLLHTFSLSGIPKMRRGEPVIEVTFDINASGILSVKAEESTTKVSQEVTVVKNKNLSQDEIDRMIKEAEENKQKDEENKKRIECIHRAKSVVFGFEDAKKDEKLNLAGEQLTKVDSLIQELNNEINNAESSKDVSKLDSLIKDAESYLIKLLQSKSKESTGSKESESTDVPEVEPTINN